MRLTLRTLLAYLDDVLPATQAREIGEKIEESAVAGSLISRIREVMRRRRLTAPTLTGPGAGIDANAVAEYLDNTLPPDGVADVEKICLESDIHLAEVAACHQILPLVLGERVDMPPRLRERMYGLGPSVARVEVVGAAPTVLEAGELESADLNSVLSQAPAAPRPQPLGPPQPLAATAPKSPAVQPKPVPPPGSFQDSLPDYLRPKRDFKKTAGYAAALLVLLGWGFLTFRNSPFGSGEPADDANGPGKDRRLAQAQGRGVGANPESGSDSPGDDETEPTDAGDSNDSSAEPIRNKSTPDKSHGKSSPTEGRGATGNRVADSEADSGKPRGAKASPPTGDLGDELDNAAPPYRKKDKAQPKGKDVAGKSKPPAKSEKEAGEDKTTQESPVEPQAPKSIGKYVSTDGVALRFNPSDEGWHVIPTGTQIDPGADLVAPTPFEAVLELNGGSVTLLPGTSISWMGENGGGPLGIQLRQGRVLIRPNSSGHKRPESLILGVALGGTLWRVELSPDAVCGLESMPPLPSRFEQTATTLGGLSSIHLASGRAKLVQTGADE
ncbi:MAG: hypothetical protein NT069_22380, partial [Planctomycetota bacterium]|nr:hypothetical protein [Planctomycetota bacterium]